ncbi:Oligopeptide transport system permease protein OppB (TC 3.A.1.5.1) [Amycolatopsis camponoti]|uniref:Oligopeptide transport system permease protein OppB (TC 3.A.1.5.1) n=1 Tax=Amycolatopsis camponoti TaxID=2606593 RepID=A0A6I8LUA8_9PSEU|nr:ABC transporter ATP-binding protein [Amycolatopsis camponoti]VVJ19046.1 Oligopeptide transport system permease protein OppB (TC 3.A.1.5.1) [Amycolatopsis camponoti]
MNAALEVTGLKVSTVAGASVLDDVSFAVAPGEVLALVGESGSGKTTAGLAALGHFRRGLAVSGGRITVGDADVLALDAGGRRRLRGSTVAYIPQDPALSLNPALRIGLQIAEVLQTHGYPGSVDERVGEVLAEVGLPSDPAYRRRYPHQLSGGQQQRVGIAMAFACRPAVVVLDEPTTGLDVVTQSLVLKTVRSLTAEHGVAALYITHDLAVVSEIADRVAVMYHGSIVECGPAASVLRTPSHAYTRRLLDAVPDPDATSTPPPPDDPLLAARGVSVSYGHNVVLREVDVSVARGECLMLLGESGSGKTTLSQCIAGLTSAYDGTVSLAGTGLAAATRHRTDEQRRRIQYVFQSPFSSLNPRKTVAQSIEVPLARLTSLSRAERRARVGEVLDRVRLGRALADRLPDQLSGGERQRAAIARALVTTPDVLVCDEVTSALDVSVQATIIELLGELRRELGMAMVFVTHNIALAGEVADRIAVLQGGSIVEEGPVRTVLSAPSHAYTRELLAATPRL